MSECLKSMTCQTLTTDPHFRGRDHLWSLRINKQWRVIFDWEESTQSAHNVQIIDYH